MTAISISITESEEQIISGIPKIISLSSNIPSTIFYTLDGSDPNLFSNIYIEPIHLPSDKLSITLKVMAVSGNETSIIISEIYSSNIINNTRLPHSSTNIEPSQAIDNLYPFGSNFDSTDTVFLNPGDSGINVNTSNQISNGFDGNGIENNFTDKPYNLENYNIKYSERNSQGEYGLGVGNLPYNNKILTEEAPPQNTSQFTKIFDPRALVIFQDFEKENPDDPSQVNRQFFSLDNSSTSRDGNAYFTSGLDAPPVNGSFLRSYYNPRENTITHYYLDTWSNKWIISKSPYKPTGNFDGNLGGVALSKNKGAGFVFEWRPFARRVLF